MSRSSYNHRRSTAHVLTLLLLGIILGASPAISRSFAVTSTDDAGTHSLRWAIAQANTTPGPDVISFAIPGNGPHTIMLLSPLPALTDDAGVIIDGLTQPGAHTGATPPASISLMIHLDGTNAGDCPGLLLQSSNNVIQGIVLTRFALEGIRIQATALETSDNTIRYCMVGTTPDGSTPEANGLLALDVPPAGISLYSPAENGGSIRGNSIYSCIISGNTGDGILLHGDGGSITNNSIRGNYIGTNKSGVSALANTGNGIAFLGDCASNEISTNIIAGNQLNGIRFAGASENQMYVQRNTISHNSIGVGSNELPIGNRRDGINIGSDDQTGYAGFARNNSVTGNTIAANGRNGITVWEHPVSEDNADGNRVSNNSIFTNRKIAIDLGDDGITLNDTGDADNGANQKVNSPTIVTAEFTGGVAIVKGTLDVNIEDAKYCIEVYRYRSNDSREVAGSLFLGSIPVSGNGNWVFSTSGTITEGDSIFTTLVSADGNTSEVSKPRPVSSSLFTELTVESSRPTSDKPAVVNIASIEPNPVLEYTEVILHTERNTWAVVQVYTPNGELVETIFDRWITKGEHKINWDVKNWKGNRVSPGWYVCIVDADATRSEKRFEVGDVTLGHVGP